MKGFVASFVLVGIGVVAWILAVGLGSALTAGTGVPLAGGLLNGVVVAMVLTIGVLATDRPLAATTMWLVFSLLSIPLTTLGPPGPYKVVLGLVAGLTWDGVYWGLRRTTVGLFLGAVLGSASIMGLLLLALRMGFGANAEQALARYLSAIYALLAVNLTVTIVGVWLGRQLYQGRLRSLKLFRDLRPLAR